MTNISTVFDWISPIKSPIRSPPKHNMDDWVCSEMLWKSVLWRPSEMKVMQCTMCTASSLKEMDMCLLIVPVKPSTWCCFLNLILTLSERGPECVVHSLRGIWVQFSHLLQKGNNSSCLRSGQRQHSHRVANTVCGDGQHVTGCVLTRGKARQSLPWSSPSHFVPLFTHPTHICIHLHTHAHTRNICLDQWLPASIGQTAAMTIELKLRSHLSVPTHTNTHTRASSGYSVTNYSLLTSQCCSKPQEIITACITGCSRNIRFTDNWLHFRSLLGHSRMCMCVFVFLFP